MPMYVTRATTAKTTAMSGSHNEGDQCRGGSTATRSSAIAARNRPTSQKKMAFSGLLGVKKSGIPENENVWTRSTRPMASEKIPRMMIWLLISIRRRFHANANTISETAIEMNSRVMCSGR
jgi:hypothetical protein